MKYLSFLLGAAALLTASCSNDEIVDITQSQAIGFNTYVDKSTRAADIIEGNATTPSTLNNFAVWAVTWSPTAKTTPSSIFIGNQVTKDGSDWTYAPPKFWAIGDNYRFTAIAPYIDTRATGSSLTVAQALDALPDKVEDIKGGLTITFDNSKANANTDLCYAFHTIENVQNTQGKVPLVFSHMLSRIKFTFINGFKSQMQAIKISGLEIQDTPAIASINKVNGETSWTRVGNTTYSKKFSMINKDGLLGEYIIGGATTTPEGGTLPSNAMESEHFYFFPLTLTQDESNAGGIAYKVAFNVTLYNYDPLNSSMVEVHTHGHSITLPAVTYKPNYSYNFIATIDDTNIDPSGKLNPIEFSASVSNWQDFGIDNTNVTVTIPQGTGNPTDPDAGGSTGGN